MKVVKLIVGQLQTNCYLAIYNDQCLIIDPGDDADYIISTIKDLEVKPIGLLATHGHFDHLLSATELKLAYSIPFYLHKADLPILKRTQSTAKHFTGLSVDPPPKADRFLKDGDILRVGKSELKVIETPGHTQGSISLKGKGIIFVGDLIFAGGGVGRTDLQGGNTKLLDKSIKKILKLPKNTIIYPGHGEETTVEEEKKFFK